MAKLDEQKRDEVPKRLLDTPPKPHKPKKRDGEHTGKSGKDRKSV